MDKVKFAELVAKTGMHFGAADGNYDDKEKAFVNLFIGFLKINANIDTDVEDIIRNSSNQFVTINRLIDETKELLADLPEAERKGTIESFASFITSVINSDGTQDSAELRDFAIWKSALM